MLLLQKPMIVNVSREPNDFGEKLNQPYTLFDLKRLELVQNLH
jgi:hypothetical protein